MKKILITGANSYIGEAVESYLSYYSEEYRINTVDTINLKITNELFEGYEVVFHVAGIAHRKETKENKHLYYEVNRDLAIKIARAAKLSGVKQFIVLSSMSVYGMETGKITKQTVENPKSCYGNSKLQADKVIASLEDETFKVAILRPPMVYGKGCKGNYQILRKFALKSPVFPAYKNQRSMIYIENLCEFVKQVIDSEKRGVYFPQNAEYVCTSEMVALIAKMNRKKICFTKIFNILLYHLPSMILKKVFGNLVYEQVDQVSKISFRESIKRCEKNNSEGKNERE